MTLRSAVNNVVLNYEHDHTFEHRVRRVTRCYTCNIYMPFTFCNVYIVTFTFACLRHYNIRPGHELRASSLLLFLIGTWLLNSVCTDTGPEVAGFRRAGGRNLDREHEHGSRRQQEVVSDERRDHSTFTDDEPHLWANGPGSRFASHCKKTSAFADLIHVISRFHKAICRLRDKLFVIYI